MTRCGLTGTARAVALSVIIPCRNAAAYLAAALASVRSQSLLPDEIIVVDDGSTDASAAIAAAVPGVRLHLQPPLGIGAARNAGLLLSAGAVIAFLDADDLWPPDSLRLRMRALEADPGLDGVCGLVEQFFTPELDQRAHSRPQAAAMTARLAGAMLLRRRAFERVGGFDATLALGDTLDLAARMDEAGLRIAAIDHIVLRRRIHRANTVLTQRGRQGDYLKVLKAALDRRRAAGARPG
jgi:glycosyltransferase involved in cell wall biosynthesis